jgi:hypothetical protein
LFIAPSWGEKPKHQRTEKPRERWTKDMAPRKRKLCGTQVILSGPAWTYRSLQTQFKKSMNCFPLQTVQSWCTIISPVLQAWENAIGWKEKEGKGGVWACVKFPTPSLLFEPITETNWRVKKGKREFYKTDVKRYSI